MKSRFFHHSKSLHRPTRKERHILNHCASLIYRVKSSLCLTSHGSNISIGTPTHKNDFWRPPFRMFIFSLVPLIESQSSVHIFHVLLPRLPCDTATRSTLSNRPDCCRPRFYTSPRLVQAIFHSCSIPSAFPTSPSRLHFPIIALST
ncbi:hypothetical protein BKA83DRAFT_176548 [Pisolithus microcarpus]|nr:hypothetical protein BKA83DRAFT_176548 [Pisolithus microcarpus]